MKFFQFFNVYEGCLESIYRESPGLYQKPFADRMERIWQHGFSSGYLYAPYLKRLGYEADFAVANCQISQLQWANEHGITLQYPHAWMYEIAWHQVNYYRPDILFITEPLTLDSKFIRMLQHRPKIVLGWRASIIPPGTDWSEFDIILSNLTAIRQVALRLGAKSSAHFWPGFEKRIFEAVRDEPKKFDLVFAGQWTDKHRDRNKILLDILDAESQDQLGFECGLYVSGNPDTMDPRVRARSRGMRYGVDYCRALRSGAAALDARGTDLDIPDPTTGKPLDLFRGETGTNRMLEVTGVGRLLLAEHYENLNKYFKFGSEIETFRSVDELVEKVRYFKQHPDLCEQIATRGHLRCMQEHSMETRVEQLHELLTTFLHKGALHVNRQSEMQNALTKARELLELRSYDEVLGMLETYTTDPQVIRDLFFVRALACYGLGQLEKSKDEIERELLVHPDNSEARELLEKIATVEVVPISPDLSKAVLSDLLG